MKWDTQPLGKYIDIISGYAFKSKDFASSGVPVIKIKNITPPEVSLDDLSYIPVQIANSLPKFELNRGDVLIALTGSHVNQMASVVGRVARVKYYTRSMLNQRVGKIVVKDETLCDLNYVYYYLSQEQVKIALARNAGGAANQANISPSDVKGLNIPFPPIEIQHKIADILSAYDNLIENNQKQIKLSEEAAMRLYKEWFVNLRFPGYENTNIVDGLPEGWNKKSINDLMTFHRGYDLTKDHMRNGLVPVVGSTSIIGYHNEFKIKGPGIVTGRSGSLGTYQLIWEDFWPHNTSLYICDYKGHDMFFIYCLLQTVDFSTLNNGGAIPTLNRNTLSNITVLEPCQDLQKKFALIAKSLYEKIYLANKQIVLLRQVRDKLLPKLMSGEIEI